MRERKGWRGRKEAQTGREEEGKGEKGYNEE